ncbi:hypothetical protein V1478_001018 [Vespula squamosa]|uniref:Uncharacterized protein n=1 Tax=Vespula squamosa TaxID=30214 RepID=A0ABD2C751_VESSQ
MILKEKEMDGLSTGKSQELVLRYLVERERQKAQYTFDHAAENILPQLVRRWPRKPVPRYPSTTMPNCPKCGKPVYFGMCQVEH